MAVMAARESWSDQRLDDLNQTVGDGFLRVEKKIESVDSKLDGLDKEVSGIDKKVEVIETRLGSLEKKVDEGSARLERDNRQLRTEMLGFGVAIIATVIGTGAFF